MYSTRGVRGIIMRKEEWIKLHAETDIGKVYVSKYGTYAYRLFGHMYDGIVAEGKPSKYWIGESLDCMFVWDISKLGNDFWATLFRKNEYVLS